MNISEVKANLTGDDLLSIANEYLKVPGLKISEIKVNEFLEVYCEYSMVFTSKFKVVLAFGSIENNKVALRIISFKLGKLPIFNFITNKILKSIIDNLKTRGIEVKENNLMLDLNEILKAIPLVTFKLRSVFMGKNLVQLHLDQISINLNKKTEDIKITEEEVEQEEIIVTEKIKDKYTEARGCIEEKVPDKYSMLLKYAMILPDFVALFYRLLKDKRVKLKTKITVATAIAYLACPVDIMPDFIPFIGKIDDIAVAIFALNRIIKDIPINVIMENWQGEDNIIIILKESLTYINKITGGSNLDKIYDTIEKVI